MLKLSLKRTSILCLYSALFVLAVLSQACSEKTPTNTFSELADSTVVGEVKFLTLSKPDTAMTGAPVVSTANSPFVYLGNEDGKSVSIVMRFLGLPDTLNVTEARIALVADTIYAGMPTGMVSATVHEIKRSWDLNTLRFEDTQNDFFEPVPVGNLMMNFPTSRDTVYIDIDTTLANKWIGLPDSLRYGVIFRPQGAFSLQRFFSINSADRQPRIQLFHDDTEGESPFEVIPASDLNVVEIVMPPVDGPYYVGNSHEHKTLLKFDLSEIPKEATINHARLIVQVDSIHSYLSDDEPFAFGVESLLEELPNLEMGADSLILNQKVRLVSNALDVFRSTVSIPANLNNLVQNWTAGRQENFGLLLETRTVSRNFYRLAIFTGDLQPERAPKLEIQYSIPPTFKRKSDEAAQ